MSEHKMTEVCPLPEVDQLPTDVKSLGDDFYHYLSRHLGRFYGCTPHYFYEALSLTIRDRIMADWRSTWVAYKNPV